MKTRSQTTIQEAAKKLVQLKKSAPAVAPRPVRTCTQPLMASGRPRRSTATPVNYAE
jgi:hypothetical protein